MRFPGGFLFNFINLFVIFDSLNVFFIKLVHRVRMFPNAYPLNLRCFLQAEQKQTRDV